MSGASRRTSAGSGQDLLASCPVNGHPGGSKAPDTARGGARRDSVGVTAIRGAWPAGESQPGPGTRGLIKGARSPTGVVYLCPICHKTCAVVASSGLLYSHGPRGAPCPGSHKAPLSDSGSRMAAVGQVRAAPSFSQPIVSPSNSASLDESSGDLFMSSSRSSPLSQAANSGTPQAW